jgi:hypothetical protein
LVYNADRDQYLLQEPKADGGTFWTQLTLQDP